MTSKGATVKRLLIYLFIAFVPSWIALFWYKAKYGLNATTALYQLIGVFSMLMPSVGAILTRIITKEGFKNSLLKLNLKGNIKYYATSMAVPVLYSILGAFLVSIFLMPDGTTSEILSKLSVLDFATTIIYLVPIAVLVCVHALGEEIGWRGYLMPKLEELTNAPLAVIIGGIIWGLWHAPMIAVGHNFGTDYKFFPYAGIIIMCIYCTLIGAFFTLLTKKTNSVFPAAISHSVNNDVGSVIISLILSHTNEIVNVNGLVYGIFSALLPVIPVGIVSFILIIKIEKDKKIRNKL